MKKVKVSDSQTNSSVSRGKLASNGIHGNFSWLLETGGNKTFNSTCEGRSEVEEVPY